MCDPPEGHGYPTHKDYLANKSHYNTNNYFGWTTGGL
jgi:hypothetical protein